MNLSWIDWGLLILAIVGLRFVSYRTKSHMKGVADFLSANRSAGRYLLTISSGMADLGTISFVAMAQVYFSAGFTSVWWGFMTLTAGTIIVITGWVYYRYRETRALTMGQFFEMRYSRRFRIFAAMLTFISGIINFGIFPAITARFFIYFTGLPEYFHIPGIPFDFSTFVIVMIAELSMALYFVIMGGQINVMVTECVQGLFTAFAFLAIVVTLFLTVSWNYMLDAATNGPAMDIQAQYAKADQTKAGANTAEAADTVAKQPVDMEKVRAEAEQKSMLHPYKTGKVKDFNVWFYLIGIFGAFYTFMAFQGTSGFTSAGKNPHEQKMGWILSTWRRVPTALVMLVMPLAAYAILHCTQFEATAAAARAALDQIKDPTVRDQMQMPVVLAHFLPIGIKGLLVTALLFCSFSTDDTYMHSWGTIFVQDVLLPIREWMGKPALTPNQHITWLRLSIGFVAAFAFVFSWLYPQTEKILFFTAISATLWLGGAGPCIIGGLYWKRGTTAGAYSAAIVGCILGVGGLCAGPIWRHLYGADATFPINGQYSWFIAMASAGVVYVVVSLISGGLRRTVDMDKLLHRGRYAVAADATADAGAPPVTGWRKVVGITPAFTFTDKLLAWSIVVWNIGWFAFFLIVTAIHFTFGTSQEWWNKFWHFYLIMQFCIGVPVVIGLSIGGILNIRTLFKALDAVGRDVTDDGRVVHKEEPAPAAGQPADAEQPVPGNGARAGEADA